MVKPGRNPRLVKREKAEAFPHPSLDRVQTTAQRIKHSCETPSVRVEQVYAAERDWRPYPVNDGIMHDLGSLQGRRLSAKMIQER